MVMQLQDTGLAWVQTHRDQKAKTGCKLASTISFKGIPNNPLYSSYRTSCLIVCLFVCLFVCDKVSLCSFGCPGTSSVDQVGLKLTEFLLPLLALKACNPTSQFKLVLFCPKTVCDLVMHAFNPRIWEVEIDISLQFKGQSNLHSKFQDSQAYLKRSCLKNKQTNKQKN